MNDSEHDDLDIRLRRLERGLSDLHTLVAETHRGNLERLNSWRQEVILGPAQQAVVMLSNAFNGQVSKLDMFLEAVSSRPMRIAIETGTFRGWTTRFLAKRFQRVFTFETNQEFLDEAKVACAEHTNVDFLLRDSGEIQQAWMQAGLPADQIDFAYLDAHWEENCPLVAELDFVLAHAPNAIVFIDDFQVHDDEAYGFDDYPTMTLKWDTIRDVVRKHNATPYYPMRRGIGDTSAFFGAIKPRGTIVIVPEKMMGTFRNMISLRPAQLS